MTEAEWQRCTIPDPMLTHLGERASERKLRLFAVACSRRVQHLIHEPGSLKALEVAERFADGRADRRALRRAYETAYGWYLYSDADPDGYFAYPLASERALVAAQCVPAPTSEELLAQAELLRELFGNPFWPVAVDPGWLAWNRGTVVQMARCIYEDQQFAELPYLADALEESACTDSAILKHCRQPGEHVRGCWVVDLLLGKD
jgi:hypothetical protein